MNYPKLKYDNNNAVFFFYYKGIYVELLRVKLVKADFKQIQHFRNMAQINLNEFNAAMSQAKASDRAA